MLKNMIRKFITPNILLSTGLYESILKYIREIENIVKITYTDLRTYTVPRAFIPIETGNLG